MGGQGWLVLHYEILKSGAGDEGSHLLVPGCSCRPAGITTIPPASGGPPAAPARHGR